MSDHTFTALRTTCSDKDTDVPGWIKDDAILALDQIAALQKQNAALRKALLDLMTATHADGYGDVDEARQQARAALSLPSAGGA